MSGMKIVVGEKFRSCIHHFPSVYRLCLRIVRDYGKVYFSVIDKKGGYTERLRSLKNLKKGQTCFIIGNGPSLKANDLELLKESGIDSFASNQIYKIFDSTNWRPTYYSVVDWKGIEENDANNMDVPYMFFSDYYWRKHRITNKNACVFYGNRLLDSRLDTFRFSEDITKQIYMKGSVTYTNFQLAMYMGYTQIYLLGMDNSYAYVMGKDGKKVKENNMGTSHFYQDENPSHIYAEKEAMDNAFLAAKEYADSHGVKIYNATRGGHLEVFERVDRKSVV